jgi:tripartite-type tricarboxylate transporter receptor subunit TctC
MDRSRIRRILGLGIAALACSFSVLAQAAWTPTKPVELIVPAGTGGGADQMARFIQGVVAKHNLMKQSIVVVNKGGGAGAEGFLDVKNDLSNPHKLIITLSNLFTTPLATGTNFNWRELTPVSMMALDQFVLWVNTEGPYKTAKDFLDDLKKQPDNTLKMGGTGSRQEDQIITVMLEKAAGKKMTYIPYKGGGEVATQLVGGHVTATVNNPIEAESHWRAGKLRPLCVFDRERLPYNAKLSNGMSWNDIPTCQDSGVPVEYVMLRGIFMPPAIKKEQIDFYIDLLAKVRATPDWAEFMERGAFRQTALTGSAYTDWLDKAETLHRELMKQAGFLSQ